MKTAVSVPDDIFAQAERCAKKLGVSRSELFTRALRQFLAEQQARDVRGSYDRAFGTEAADESVEQRHDDGRELSRHGARRLLSDTEW